MLLPSRLQVRILYGPPNNKEKMMNINLIVEVTQAELDKLNTCAAGLEFDLLTDPHLKFALGQLKVVVVKETDTQNQVTELQSLMARMQRAVTSEFSSGAINTQRQVA